MVRILHGEDIAASYRRLQDLLSSNKNAQKVNVSAENMSLFEQLAYGQDMFYEEKLIVAENLLTLNKISTSQIQKIPKTQNIIFWEKKELTSATLKKFPTGSIVEIFKISPVLFKFLDSLGSSSKQEISLLRQIPTGSQSITWNMSNRLLLLLLAKSGFSPSLASKVISRQIQDWQWRKIVNQADNFNIKTLQVLLDSTLKIETMVKSGFTNQDEKTLIGLMLLKGPRN